MPDAASGLTPIALTFTLLMGVLTLLLSRRFAVIPLIITACYMTVGERIVFLGLNFTILRIIILFGWLRIIARRDFTSIRINVIDKTIIWWVIFGLFIRLFNAPTFSDLIENSGYAYNAIGIYFFFRFYLTGLDDIITILKVTALLILPLAISMLVEKSTGRNIFSVFGGVPEVTMLRDGTLRCQGPFRHPIIAGTFGATLMPLMMGLFLKDKGFRLLAITGIISATIITVTSGSSGPAMAFLFGIIGFAMWPFRNNMRLIRWGILFTIIGLHIYMKDPVWFILERISDITGGGGWHRSQIINQAINYFGEWWLVGTKYTAHWMPYVLPVNPNMVDITNQYIWEGVSGGIVRMVLFITIIALSFKKVGLYLKTLGDKPFVKKIMIWSIGVALLAHVVSYISIVYFDQMVMFWFLLLAMIAALPTTSEDISAQTMHQVEEGEFRAI